MKKCILFSLRPRFCCYWNVSCCDNMRFKNNFPSFAQTQKNLLVLHLVLVRNVFSYSFMQYANYVKFYFLPFAASNIFCVYQIVLTWCDDDERAGRLHRFLWLFCWVCGWNTISAVNNQLEVCLLKHPMADENTDANGFLWMFHKICLNINSCRQ